MRFYRGVVRSYDSTNHKADVLLVGSMSRLALAVPVSQDIDPQLMVEGAGCGVLFFEDGASGVVVCTIGDAPTPGLVLDAYGPALTLDDVVLGWWDHFLGESLDARYDTSVVGAGTVGLWGSVSQGWVRLANDASAFHRVYLWLGDSGGAYATFQAVPGWVQACRMRVNNLTSGEVHFGCMDATETNGILAGYNASYGSHWEIALIDSGGAWQHIQSDVDARTDDVVMALQAQDMGGGVCQLKMWLDGVLLLTIDGGTYDIQTSVLTPVLRVQNRAAVQTIGRWDWWFASP